jgi:hypothetical protein
MKENKKVVVLVSVLVLIVTFTVTSYIYALNYASGGPQNITSTINSSRYIMFGGAYNITRSDKVGNAVFKLDTYTGDTWILNVQLEANGNQSEIWVPVDAKASKIIPANPDVSRIKELYN